MRVIVVVGVQARNRQQKGQRIQRVASGLFVLRYASSTDRRSPPHVTIENEVGSAVSVLCDLPSGVPVMRAPGDAVVLHAGSDSFVRILVEPSVPGGSTDAQLVLERVSCSLGPDEFKSDFESNRAGARSASDEFSVLAHVSRRGDVSVRAGEWICGPSAPLAIEGIQLIWPDRPAGIDILTSVVINLNGRRVQAPVQLGQFIGTRQKAAPIVGLTFNLTGPAAHLYSLDVEALFLGGVVLNKSGIFVEMSGNSGMEPLVGFRLSISGLGVGAQSDMLSPNSKGQAIAVATPANEYFADESVVAPTREGSDLPKASRVRIFRAARPSLSSNISVD